MSRFEKATLCSEKDSFGILLTVNSNEHNPPHAHCKDLSGKLLGRFLITQTPPIKIEDIVNLTPDETGYIPEDTLHVIVKWSTMYKNSINNWLRLINAWELLNLDE